jgi:predicted nuclease of predicted toxin-antitoxin system
MKLLLDENLPKKLKLDFPQHEVYTVADKKWNGIKNGQLLQLMLSENFDVLLTFDKNLQHHQNFSKHIITVIVLTCFLNNYDSLTKFYNEINLILQNGNMPNGAIIIS